MKKRFLIIVLAFLVITILLILGYVSGLSQISEEFETVEPRAYAIELARSNLALQEAIGQIIQVDTLLDQSNKQQGQLQLSFSSKGLDLSANAVDLEVPLIGEQGMAKLYVEAEKEEDTWIYDLLQVIVESSKDTINLIQE